MIRAHAGWVRIEGAPCDHIQGPGDHVEIREQAALLPDTEGECDGNSVPIVKVVQVRRETRGERVVRRLRGSATTRMATDEILALTRGED